MPRVRCVYSGDQLDVSLQVVSECGLMSLSSPVVIRRVLRVARSLGSIESLIIADAGSASLRTGVSVFADFMLNTTWVLEVSYRDGWPAGVVPLMGIDVRW